MPRKKAARFAPNPEDKWGPKRRAGRAPKEDVSSSSAPSSAAAAAGVATTTQEEDVSSPAAAAAKGGEEDSFSNKTGSLLQNDKSGVEIKEANANADFANVSDDLKSPPDLKRAKRS